MFCLDQGWKNSTCGQFVLWLSYGIPFIWVRDTETVLKHLLPLCKCLQIGKLNLLRRCHTLWHEALQTLPVMWLCLVPEKTILQCLGKRRAAPDLQSWSERKELVFFFAVLASWSVKVGKVWVGSTYFHILAVHCPHHFLSGRSILPEWLKQESLVLVLGFISWNI